MPINNYGVWVATPILFTAERTGKSPHGALTFSDGTSKYKSTTADINVKSTTTDTRLVYWNNAQFTNAITENLASLAKGFTSLSNAATGSAGVRLDLLRGGLETLTSGTVLETSVAGANNDIVDDLTTIFSNAISQKATVYLWGQQYVDSSSVAGIHDIHMNQGDTAPFTSDNGIWQDGSFILKFPDGHYEAVFLAFAEQYTQTDDSGNPITTAPTFATLLNAPNTSSQKTSGATDGKGPNSHRHKKHAKRHGHQYEISPLKWAPGSGSERPSHVTVLDAEQKRNMKGWSLTNDQGTDRQIHDEEAEGIHNGKEVGFADMALDPAGGIVYLKDANGHTVNDMVYSKFH